MSFATIHQNFPLKGWSSCSTQFDLGPDEIEYEIKSSPTRHCKESHKRLPVQEGFLRKKPMLVEISNIESVFKGKEVKSPNTSSPQNFFEFKKNLYEKEKCPKNYQHKRLKSGSFNLEHIKASFQIQKQHISETPKSCDFTTGLMANDPPYKISSCKNDHSINRSKLRNSSETFINNSFNKLHVNKNTASYAITESSLIPVKVRPSKVLCTFLSSGFVNEENETTIGSSSKKYVSGSIRSKRLANSSNSHQTVSSERVYASTCVSFGKENDTYISNCSSDLSISPNNLINNDTGSEQEKSPEIQHTSMSVSSVQKFKERKETFKCEYINENVESKALMNNPKSDQVNSSYNICTHIHIPFVEDNETFISNYSSDLSVHSKNLLEYSSPAEVKSPEISCTPQSVESVQHFEERNDVLNFEHKISQSSKSLVFENKAFMKTLKERCSSADKGSSWVQSLNWADISLTKGAASETSDHAGKKIVKNIVQGGFAEQMLKLQRRERSDRVIWNHKKNELKKKVMTSSITFTLASFLQIGQIIVTKCYASEKDNDSFKDSLHLAESADFHINFPLPSFDELKDSFCNNFIKNAGLKPFIVLFRRDAFSKLHLKIREMFVLYPPWQMLSKMPVLLCTYYVDTLNKSLDIPNASPVVDSQPVIYYSLQSVECEELKFSKSVLTDSYNLYGRCVCLSARVQRIWKNFISNNIVQDTLKMNFSSFSVLLQSKEGIFLELKIHTNDLPQSYQEFLSDSEGHCFKFCDIIMSHRYNLNKYQELSRIIEFIQKETKSSTTSLSSQIYCCQFIPRSLSKPPRKISDESFPKYCGLELTPLSFVQKNSLSGSRVSSIGKVLFQHKDDFYVSDESLLGTKLRKYYKVKFTSLSQVPKKTVVGATVLIKEAISNEDFLFVDKFSSCEIISNATSKLTQSCESRLQKIGFITCEHILSPLSLSSEVEELVLVKGIITHVDENSAISWLECSQCWKENLLEDSNSVIYCEDCSCIVSNPVLKVKMEVVIQCADLSSVKIKIRLQSTTIKRILNIREDNFNPQCNISDVLKKTTGVLSCYIRDIEIVNKQKVFLLTEMISC